MVMESSNHYYHERQVRELCALHALNNLFQQKDFFTKREMDSICFELSPYNWINPHKSILGLGNYDVNVIMKALQSRGYEAIWFDKRKDPRCLNLDTIEGCILNIPNKFRINFLTNLLNRRHWIALKQLNGQFYNLDSKLNVPQLIGSKKDMLNFIKAHLESQDNELFIVVNNEVYKNQSWLSENSDYNNKICDDKDSRDAEEVFITDI